MFQGRFAQTLLLLSLTFSGISANTETNTTAFYEGEIHVDICSDTPEGTGLSFAFKTAIENTIKEYYEGVHIDDGFVVQAVEVDDEAFMQATECPDSEDGVERRRLRGSIFSSIYFILTGFCFGSCPEDPSDAIDTVNRLRNLQISVESSVESSVQSSVQSSAPTKTIEEKNAELTEIMQSSFSEITHAEFEKTGESKTCYWIEECGDVEICCEDNSCSCGFNLCDSEGMNCFRADLHCLDDSSCDNSVTITPSRNTLVIGSGFLDDESVVRVYDVEYFENFQDAKYLQRGNDISSPDTSGSGSKSKYYKRGGAFGSSVSISSDGNRLAVGAYKKNTVSLFDWTNGEWERVEDLEGEKKSMFGISLDLSNSGNRLVIGAPNQKSNTGEKSGAVYVYKSSSKNGNQFELYGRKNPLVSKRELRFGWTVQYIYSDSFKANYRYDADNYKTFEYDDASDKWKKKKN